MSARSPLIVAAFLVFGFVAGSVRLCEACCPAPHPGQPVVNADQTVIIVWDPISQTEHFIRRASFKSAADDFGFIVPTPTQPDLSESGDRAFPLLAEATAPMVMPRQQGSGCGCSKAGPMPGAAVNVLEEKTVAGFHAVVLEAQSSEDLLRWLREHDYAFTSEMKVWADPYVQQGWKFTAMKVDKTARQDPSTSPALPAAGTTDVAAAALRISFKTDKPLFPYREPDPQAAAKAVGAKSRTLRIYFISDARYEGGLPAGDSWTGKPVWSGPMPQDTFERVTEQLRLPAVTTPKNWWLTEFEDNWPYRAAPADLYFWRSADQTSLQRPMQQASAEPWRPLEAAPYLLAIFAIVGFPHLKRVVGRW